MGLKHINKLSAILPLSIASSIIYNSNRCISKGEGSEEKITNDQQLIVSNPDTFTRKLRAFQKGGKSNLIVISDFDYTLSPSKFNNIQVQSSHGILENCKAMPIEYKTKALDLFRHYHAIEISPTLNHEEKLPYMLEWWRKGHQLMIDYKLHKNYISQSVNDTYLPLRSGFRDLMNVLSQNSIPTLIFSAGLGDIIEAVLINNEGSEILTPNLHIISNTLSFNNQGYLNEFQGKKIHTHNKSAKVFEGTPFFYQCDKRENVLLIGDSVGDANMADGLHYNEILKVAYLNHHVEERLEEYMNVFDVVIVGDGSLAPVQTIVDIACNSNSQSHSCKIPMLS